MTIKKLSVGFLAAAMTTPVLADKQSDLELYLGVGHYFWDSDRDLDDSTSLELGAELPVSERLSFEAWLSDFDADVEDADVELDGRRYAAGGLYHLMDGDYRPFLSAGVAHQEFEIPDSDDADETLLYVGAGAKKYFDNNLMLRGEVLAMNSLDYEMTDLGVRVTLGYAFGGSSAAPVEAAAKPVAVKEASPEPKPEAKPKPESKVEPAPKPEPKPAPVDSDGDGVVDARDQCPDTDAAFKVDAKGCPIKLVKTISIDMQVKFKTNSAEFSDADGEVKKLAEFLNTYQDTSVIVEGHTDDRGAAAYNKSLSQKRADAVKAMLVDSYGIAASRVEAVGYGEEQPVASNDTAEGRAQNRRVIGKVSADVESAVRK